MKFTSENILELRRHRCMLLDRGAKVSEIVDNAFTAENIPDNLKINCEVWQVIYDSNHKLTGEERKKRLIELHQRGLND